MVEMEKKNNHKNGRSIVYNFHPLKTIPQNVFPINKDELKMIEKQNLKEYFSELYIQRIINVDSHSLTFENAYSIALINVITMTTTITIYNGNYNSNTNLYLVSKSANISFASITSHIEI